MSNINDYYEKYHASYGGKGYNMESVKHTSRVQILCEWISEWVTPGGRILDVGCGDMTLSKLLPDYDWVGLDISTDLAPEAIKHDLQVAPYPLDPASLDGAVCSEVLEHLFDPLLVHREVHRCLKRGAPYLVSTPNFSHLDHFFTHNWEVLYNPAESHRVEHIRWYDNNTHRRDLETCGFMVYENCGADAHFSKCMQQARNSLVKQGIAKDLFHADVILGKCFPETSHTIMLRGRKK